jgi:hypothetical protein
VTLPADFISNNANGYPGTNSGNTTDPGNPPRPPHNAGIQAAPADMQAPPVTPPVAAPPAMVTPPTPVAPPATGAPSTAIAPVTP